MKKGKFTLAIIFFLLFRGSLCLGLAPAELGQFNTEDRVLIFAPHPDDEAIATGGVIQRALKAGAKVKIVCYTNGDNNELAFIVYEKRITFKKREFIHMGEVRRKETIAAMGSLGIPAQDIIFLGYPDFGTMEILTKYWGETKPFRSMLTKVSKVPYPECLSPNAPYVGESILKDLKSVLLDFKPNKIFVSHPADSNRDHRALYLFLRVALWDLQAQIKPPVIFPYIIHVVGWPKPRGYHPDLELIPADKFKESGIFWQKFVLTQGEIKAKRDATKYYKSQIKYNPAYLFTFCRKNELYGDFSSVELKKQKAGLLDWQTLKAYGEEEKSTRAEVKNQIDRISALAYACSGDNLFIKLTLTRKRAGVSIFLLGYSKKTDFAQMPKMNLFVDKYGLHIKDKKQTFFIKEIELKYLADTIVIKIPLAALGNPDFILSWVKARTSDLSVDETSWRVLELRKEFP